MPEVGFEPTRAEARGILSPLRLPFRHSGSGVRNPGNDRGFHGIGQREGGSLQILQGVRIIRKHLIITGEEA